VILDPNSARLDRDDDDEVVSDLGGLAERIDPGEAMGLISEFDLDAASGTRPRDIGRHARWLQTGAAHAVEMHGGCNTSSTNKGVS